MESYFKLSNVFHNVISNVKGIKTLIKNQKELIINTIKCVKDSIPINNALKVFNISKSTYQNHKTIVIHTYEGYYFKWFVRKIPNQLLAKEVLTIKSCKEHESYKYWYKSSVYLKAV